VRVVASRSIGLAGLAAYNWWVWVLAFTSWPTSPNVLFSDLETAGGPHAALLSHLDVAAGLLLLLALLLQGRPGAASPRLVWSLLIGFTLACIVGGLFPYVCPEGASAVCRSAEWHFRLPFRHYIHVVSGITEFALITLAVLVAWRRRVEVSEPLAKTASAVGVVLLVAYPLLAVAYLTDRLGAVVEPVFFVGWSAVLGSQLWTSTNQVE
jgi:hypothetical protein